MSSPQTETANPPFRHFYQLLAGKTISDIGNFLDMVALNLYVFVVTGSAFQMGMFMAVRLFGGFITGFYSGILADRMNRKHLMIFADVVRAALMLSLVLTPAGWHLYLLYPVAFLIGIGNSLFGVAMQSSIPVVVGSDQRVRANALLSAWGSVAMVIGLVTSGTMLGVLGYKTIFAIDAATYLISAVNLLFLPIRTSEARAGSKAAEKSSFFAEFRNIFQYLRLTPVLLGVMAIRLVDTLGSASHNVGMPIFSAQMRPEQPSLFMGLIWAVWAVGNLSGSRGMSKWFKAEREAHTERAFGISTIFMSLFFILVFWGDSLYWILPAAFLAGISDGVSGVCYNSRLQQVTDEKRGRVFGVSSTLQTVGFGVGMVICAPLFDLYRPVLVVGLLHGLPMVIAIYFTLYYFRKWKAETSSSGSLQETRSL
jgi:MFS family permease